MTSTVTSQCYHLLQWPDSGRLCFHSSHTLLITWKKSWIANTHTFQSQPKLFLSRQPEYNLSTMRQKSNVKLNDKMKPQGQDQTIHFTIDGIFVCGASDVTWRHFSQSERAVFKIEVPQSPQRLCRSLALVLTFESTFINTFIVTN